MKTRGINYISELHYSSTLGHINSRGDYTLKRFFSVKNVCVDLPLRACTKILLPPEWVGRRAALDPQELELWKAVSCLVGTRTPKASAREASALHRWATSPGRHYPFHFLVSATTEPSLQPRHYTFLRGTGGGGTEGGYVKCSACIAMEDVTA